MRNRKHQRRAEESGLSLTSMIDVTFLLLVFFLLTIEFRTLDGKLSAYLPKGEGIQPDPIARQLDVDVTIRVVEPGRRVAPGTSRSWSGTGRFELADRVVRYGVGPRVHADPATLLADLAALRRADPERKVRIDAGSGTVTQDVVTAVDTAIEAGFDEIAFTGAHR